MYHCRWPIHASKRERASNSIEVIKRVACGYNNSRCFELEAKQAFA